MNSSIVRKLDVVMTATLRPDLLELTLWSFKKNFFFQFSETRLFINIDLIGNSKCKPKDILRICRKYFDNVVFRSPDEPSFSKAVRWGWENIDSEYFLHLEDDWVLKKKIVFEKAEELFELDENIASVRFNSSHNTPEFPVVSPGFSLNPSIIRKKYTEEALSLFSDEKDPEKQFCNLEGEKANILGHWKYLCYGEPNAPPYVIDTGRMWRKYNHLSKWQADSDKITWNKRRTTNHHIFHRVKFELHKLYWKGLVHNLWRK